MIYYFAYGSCMDELDFKRTVGEFQTLGRAILPDYRLIFSLYGESRRGGVADVIPAKGEQVEGVLYTFDEKFLPLLDEREGVHAGNYERIEVAVWYEGERLTVYTYQVVDKAAEEIAPSLYYMGLILSGLQAYASDEYRLAFIRRMKDRFSLEAEAAEQEVVKRRKSQGR
jgi:cation transport regulator ChaC